MSRVKVLASGAALLVVGGAVLVVACVAVAQKPVYKDGVILAADSSGVVESVPSQSEPLNALESADLSQVAAAPPVSGRGAAKATTIQAEPDPFGQTQQPATAQQQPNDNSTFGSNSQPRTATSVPEPATVEVPPTICLHVIPGKLIISQSAGQAATMAKQLPADGLLVMCQGVTVESKIVEGKPTMSLKCQSVTIKGAQGFEAQADQLVVEGVPSLLKLSGSDETPVRLRRVLPGAAEPLSVSAETVTINVQKWSVHATDSKSSFQCNFTIAPAAKRSAFSARSTSTSEFSPF
ncbi:MAG: hypothetical protein CMJ48_11720 [Planctomycetaceae bacterium]|nr:hypothetical protein [Planctomycetaceae bacterium]